MIFKFDLNMQTTKIFVVIFDEDCFDPFNSGHGVIHCVDIIFPDLNS